MVSPFFFSIRSFCNLFLLRQVIILVDRQAVDEDNIDLSVIPGYQDLDNCVKCWLHDCCAVLDNCKDLDDASMAVSFYTAYCSTKGFTEIVSPTILQPTAKDPPRTTVRSPPTSFTPTLTSSVNPVSPLPTWTQPSAPTPTTKDTTGPPPTASTNLQSPTPENTQDDMEDNKDGLDTGALVGIILGVISTIATITGAYYTWRAWQGRRTRNGAGERSVGEMYQGHIGISTIH
ncbi:hypothetical protein V8F20_005210 [Naviculisporaceae sp. PSN 640]